MPKSKAPEQKPKSDKRVAVKIADAEKARLRELLKSDENYAGKLSDFINDCIRSYKFQRNRGERLRYPIEFVKE